MTTMPMAQARDHLAEVVESVQKTHDRVTLTRHGQPAAVIIAAADLDSILETLAVLSTPGALEAIREGAADVAAGRFVTMEDMRAAVRDRAAGG
ncbi:MAG TPA: type II toxin-antitoxin system Phd/YefM family antitoxin [Nakamurella sp.]|nr:type II toxin-antitoxin system Phd/YefM family antitoxin [Nakamurella sp.]